MQSTDLPHSHMQQMHFSLYIYVCVCVCSYKNKCSSSYFTNAYMPLIIYFHFHCLLCYASRSHSKAMTITIYTIPIWMHPQRIEIMNKNKRKYQHNLCRKEERLNLKNLPKTRRWRVWKQRTLHISLQ
jgi:hypothetical protein